VQYNQICAASGAEVAQASLEFAGRFLYSLNLQAHT
jgi:hypothetical protein